MARLTSDLSFKRSPQLTLDPLSTIWKRRKYIKVLSVSQPLPPSFFLLVASNSVSSDKIAFQNDAFALPTISCPLFSSSLAPLSFGLSPSLSLPFGPISGVPLRRISNIVHPSINQFLSLSSLHLCLSILVSSFLLFAHSSSLTPSSSVGLHNPLWRLFRLFWQSSSSSFSHSSSTLHLFPLSFHAFQNISDVSHNTKRCLCF